jgi:hypothetical protein
MASEKFSTYAGTTPATGAPLWLNGIKTANTIFVDSTNGNDSTGLRGRQDLPFATLNAAITAANITSGDLVYICNGAYAPPGGVFVPAGVNVWGESMNGVQVTMPATNPDIFQPGSGSALNQLCVFGNMTVIGQKTSGPIGIVSGASGSTAVSTNVLLKNLNVIGTVDCIFINLGTFGSAYWRCENCYFSSTYDTLFANAGTGSSQTLQIDYVDCTHTITGGTQLATYHVVNCGTNQTAGNTVLVRDFGGVWSVNGSSTTSSTVNAIQAASGVTVELHGTSIAVSQPGGVGGGTPLSVNVASGGTVKYNAACVIDPTTVSGAGKFIGLAGQIAIQETSGQTQDVIDVYNSAASLVFSVTYTGIVATGTWQGTTVGVTYGGSGANLSATGGTGQYVKQVTSGGAFTVGVIASADLPTNGPVTATQFLGSGATPTIALGTGATGTPSLGSPVGSVSGTQAKMQVSVTTGTTPLGSGAVVATITVPTAFPGTPHPVFSPANAATALLSGATMVFVDGGSTTTIVITSGTSGLVGATTYLWNIET